LILTPENAGGPEHVDRGSVTSITIVTPELEIGSELPMSSGSITPVYVRPTSASAETETTSSFEDDDAPPILEPRITST
jgi:hypothetical protein